MNAPRICSRRPASRRPKTRRMVDSSGPLAVVTPSVCRVSMGCWATHSPIATNDLAPAMTARPTARMTGRPCCRPGRPRGSGIFSVAPPTRPGLVGGEGDTTAGVGEDDVDGCGLRLDGELQNFIQALRRPPSAATPGLAPLKSHGPRPSLTPHRSGEAKLAVNALQAVLAGAWVRGHPMGRGTPSPRRQAGHHWSVAGQQAVELVLGGLGATRPALRRQLVTLP